MRPATETEKKVFYAGANAAVDSCLFRLRKAVDDLSKAPFDEAADYRRGLTRAIALLTPYERIEFSDVEEDRIIAKAIG